MDILILFDAMLILNIGEYITQNSFCTESGPFYFLSTHFSVSGFSHRGSDSKQFSKVISLPSDAISKQKFLDYIEGSEIFVQVFKLLNSSESKQSLRCMFKGLKVYFSCPNFGPTPTLLSEETTLLKCLWQE